MRLVLVLTLYNILSVVLAEFDIINEDIGDFHLSANVGNLPLKYIPLSEQDIKASEKAADVVDFITLVPNIDPMNIAVVKPLSFNLPFLWLNGKVSLKNVVMSGVKQVELHGLELRLINLRSDVNITIPQIYFEADIHLQAAISFLPTTFKCHLSANLYEMAIAVTSGGYKALAPTIGEVLQIDSAAVKVDIKDVVFNVTNMVIGDQLGEYGYTDGDSPFISSRFFSSKKGKNDNMLNGFLKTALDMVNEELSKFSIDVFTDYLLSDTY